MMKGNMAAILKFVALMCVVFLVKKPSLTSAESRIYDLSNVESHPNTVETFIYSSIWAYMQEHGLFVRKRYIWRFLLLLSGDIELCPGPSRIICSCCSKTIRKNQSVGICSGCSQRFHLKCLHDKLVHNKEVLHCNVCYSTDSQTNEDMESGNVQIYENLLWFVKQRGLKVLHQNINGLKNKLAQVKHVLSCMNKNTHIFGLTETHTNINISDCELEIEGYTIIRKDRLSGNGGGVMCYVRNDLNWQRRQDLEAAEIESICIELFITKSSPIIVMIMYKPPDSSSHLHQNFTESLRDVISISANENKELLVTGDLNCDYLVAEDHKTIKQVFKENGMKQVIKSPTRITSHSRTLIDVVITTHSERIANHIVYPSSLSDHDLIGVIRKINIQKFKPRKIICNDYSRYNKDDFKRDLSNLSWVDVINEQSLNRAWDLFKNILSATIFKHAPLKEKLVRGKDCPWMTSKIRQEIRTRDYHLKKARRTNAEIDWSSYRRLRNSVTAQIRSAKANYQRDILKEETNDPKKFWRQIRKCYPSGTKNRKCSKSFTVDGNKVKDKKEIANGFCSFFTNVAKNLQNEMTSVTSRIWKNRSHITYSLAQLNENNKEFCFKTVEHREVLRELKQIKQGKAFGIDQIPPNLLKDGAEEIAPILTHLINCSLVTSTFPSIEKIAKVIPIYKADSYDLFDNYRPVSVLPITSKILERMVYNQVYAFLERNYFITPYQFGFRKGHNTKHATTYLIDCIREGMDKGQYTGAIYIDLRKAFDSVDHAILLTKLPQYGIKGKELEWFEDYLFGRQQLVQFEDTASERLFVTTGVPQGSILGPLLFLLHINDVVGTIDRSKMLLYADDMVMYYSNNSVKNVEEVLTIEFERVLDWLKENELIINPKEGKTEALLFGTQQKLKKAAKLNISTSAVTINTTEVYEYLGTTLDQSLTFKPHVEKVCKKVSSRVKLLSRIRKEISPHTAESIYKAMIQPLLMTSENELMTSAIMNNKYQALQDRAHKIVCGKRTSDNQWPTVKQLCSEQVATQVYQAIHNQGPDIFNEYFEILNHGKNTRGDQKGLRLPKVKSENGRKTYRFQGAFLFNTIPKDVISEDNITTFKHRGRNFFRSNNNLLTF